MRSGHKLWPLAICSFLLFASLAVAQGPAKQDVLNKKDTRVEPTSWGNVVGRVYDASTGAPIQAAAISIETDEGFQTKGRSIGKTDELGGYRAQCVLGRISHNFDVGRALLTSGIGMLFGGAGRLLTLWYAPGVGMVRRLNEKSGIDEILVGFRRP